MTLILLLNLVFSNFQAEKLKKTDLTDNITMLVPETFRPMTDDELVSKYYTTRKPLVMLTNQDLSIDLGVNKSATNWNEDDIEIMMDFQKANIFSLYDQVSMISEGTKELKGRKYVYFEFESIIKSDKDAFIKQSAIKKYTYIQYVIIGKESLVFNFTCSSMIRNQWAGQAQKMMDSIEIKGRLK
ncbi:MAG: hypothetical protein JXR07_06495 [Reichenbachiella sp.]